MRTLQHRWIRILPQVLFGADGEEDETVEPQEGAEGDSDEKPVEDKFSQEYVDGLRKEAAGHRIKTKAEAERADAAVAELAKIKQAEMSDLENAQTDLETANARAEEAEAGQLASSAKLKSERIFNAVTLAAIEAGFEDPTDALSMISQDDLVDDEGNIVQKTVTARLKTLASKKPYLLKKSRPGSSDGGPTGDPVGAGTFEEKQAAYFKDMTTTGGRIQI